jgi:hypothetical protein
MRIVGYSLLVTTLISCAAQPAQNKRSSDGRQADDDAHSSGQENNEDANPKVSETDPKAPTPIKLVQQGYNRKLGDIYVAESLSKSWVISDPEPSFPTTPTLSEHSVVGIYKAGLKCKYRAKIKDSGIESANDFDCSFSANSCEELSSDTSCTSQDLESATLGTKKHPDLFHNAKGVRKTCTTKTEIDADTVQISKSIIETWTHELSFARDSAIKISSILCNGAMKKTDATNLTDLCALTGKDFEIQKSKSEWKITEQTHGPGGLEYTAGESSGLDIDIAGKAITFDSNAAVTCTVKNNKLDVGLTGHFCQDKKTKMFALNIAELATDELQESPITPAQINASVGFDGWTSKSGCNVTTKRDKYNQMIHGTVICGTKFPGQATELLIRKSTFSCFSPKGYPKFEYAADENFAGKLFKSSVASGGDGGSEKPTDGGGTESGTTTGGSTEGSGSGTDGAGGNDGSGTGGNDGSGTGGNDGSGTGGNDGSGTGANDGSGTDGSGAGDSDGSGTDGGGTTNKIQLPSGRQYIFVTSTKFPGDLGGRSGADEHCNAVADGSKFKFPTKFKALLSTADMNLKFSVPIPATGEVYSLNGDLVAKENTVFKKTAEEVFYLNALLAEPKYDENGDLIKEVSGPPLVQTGSTLQGVYQTGADCNGWTENFWSVKKNLGAANRNGLTRWRDRTDSCNALARLYCLSLP